MTNQKSKFLYYLFKYRSDATSLRSLLPQCVSKHTRHNCIGGESTAIDRPEDQTQSLALGGRNIYQFNIWVVIFQCDSKK